MNATVRQLWIWLTIGFGPANKRKWEVMAGFDGIEDFYRGFMRGNTQLTPEEIKRLSSIDMQKLSEIEEYCKSKGIDIFCFDDVQYPQRLRDIFNPPSIIFVKGDISDFDLRATLTVAGARELSDYSRNTEHELVGALCDRGVEIVSGIQIGADQEAVYAALESGGKAYAVLGFGMGYEYPKGSAELVAKISENGAVITEYFPNHKPRSKDFHNRNRLLAALGLGVFVIQATVKSGSLSIAEYALNQGKDVFVLPPHEIFSPVYKGNVMLLRDGAYPVYGARDIIAELEGRNLSADNIKLKLKPTKEIDKDASFEKSVINKSEESDAMTEKSSPKASKQTKPVEEKFQIDMSELSEIGKQIVDALKNGALSADEISSTVGVDMMELNLELTELEIMGAVKSLPGRRYSFK